MDIGFAKGVLVHAHQNMMREYRGRVATIDIVTE
jgi:hypothetical protein